MPSLISTYLAQLFRYPGIFQTITTYQDFFSIFVFCRQWHLLRANQIALLALSACLEEKNFYVIYVTLFEKSYLPRDTGKIISIKNFTISEMRLLRMATIAGMTAAIKEEP